MLTEVQQKQLEAFVKDLNPNQLVWVQGFLAGMSYRQSGLATSEIPQLTLPVPTGPSFEVVVGYGTQTGNAKGVATKLTEALKTAGVSAKLQDLGGIKPQVLRDWTHLLAIVSTHGDGDAPDSLIPLFKYLNGKKAPNLAQLNIGILALGDSSYPKFCQTGIDLEARLLDLGAKLLLPRTDCDADYQATAEAWMQQVVTQLTAIQPVAAPSALGALGGDGAALKASLSIPAYAKERPFAAELLHKVNLNDRASDKATWHLEVSLTDSGLHYEVGDTLGVYPENAPDLVQAILKKLNRSADTPIVYEGETLPLELLLRTKVELGSLTPKFLQSLPHTAFEHASQSLDFIRTYADGRDFLDLLASSDFGSDLAPVLNQLPKLKPRLYSIASSLKAVEEEAHLTVGRVDWTAHDRARKGVCSHYLATQTVGETISVFVQENPNFRLPDAETPILMVGAGTGVAPFRAFLQEREATEARGKNWLFFGDRRFRTDFLYQKEWLAWKKTGLLTDLSLAFSRDQAEKIYVQHRLLERAADVWAWLQEGAVFYVCGDAQYMAKDVDQALRHIVQTQGNLDAEAADAFLDDLILDKRYLRDVY